MTNRFSRRLWNRGVGGAAGAPPFDFSAVNGYTIDWDASLGVTTTSGSPPTDGEDVTSWIDQGSGAYDGQTDGVPPSYVASYAPLNGQPAIQFAKASSERLILASISEVASEWTWYFVLDTDDHTNGTQNIFDTATGRLRFLISASDYQFQSPGGLVGTQVAQSGPTLLTYILDSPSSGTIREDLTQVETGLTYTNSALGGTTRIGSRSNGSPGGTYGGHIARILGYNAVHTAPEITSVEGALNTLYGPF